MDAINVGTDSHGETTESHVNYHGSDGQEDGVCQTFAFVGVKVEVEVRKGTFNLQLHTCLSLQA
jgi:CO/xanthine dehydrogenase Mo-binding subunit